MSSTKKNQAGIKQSQEPVIGFGLSTFLKWKIIALGRLKTLFQIVEGSRSGLKIRVRGNFLSELSLVVAPY